MARVRVGVRVRARVRARFTAGDTCIPPTTSDRGEGVADPNIPLMEVLGLGSGLGSGLGLGLG